VIELRLLPYLIDLEGDLMGHASAFDLGLGQPAVERSLIKSQSPRGPGDKEAPPTSNRADFHCPGLRKPRAGRGVSGSFFSSQSAGNQRVVGSLGDLAIFADLEAFELASINQRIDRWDRPKTSIS